MRRLGTVVLLLAGLATPSLAGRYFRPGLDAARVGVFQDFENKRQEFGFVVPVVVHDKSDGYWLVPGITWDLLDLGYSQEKQDDGKLRRALRVGPSVNLDEPVKAALRWACKGLPGWSADPAHYSLLRGAFAPGADGALAIGPSFRLEASKLELRAIKGGVDYSVTLHKRFGGPKE